jgi:hypothetical protein
VRIDKKKKFVLLRISFRCLAFEPTNASYVLSGSNDMLRVYNWEPIQLLDTVQMGWKNVVDMTIHKDQLVCFNFILLFRILF